MISDLDFAPYLIGSVDKARDVSIAFMSCKVGLCPMNSSMPAAYVAFEMFAEEKLAV